MKLRIKRNDVRALAVCILVSCTIWLLRSLNKEVSASIQVPLVIESPKGCESVQLSTAYIELEVTASGFLLLGRQFFKRERDFTLPASILPAGRNFTTVPLSDYTRELRRIAGADFSIVSISPDSVHVNCK